VSAGIFSIVTHSLLQSHINIGTMGILTVISNYIQDVPKVLGQILLVSFLHQNKEKRSYQCVSANT